jgi:hypothetical protein
VLDRLLRRQDQAEDVQVELLVEVVGGHVLQRGKLVHAGVVDQDVDPPERPLGLAEQSADVGLLGHVGLHGDGLAAAAGDLRNHPVGPVLAGRVVDHHGRPLGRQVLGDGSSDSLGCAGDDGDLTVQFLRHGRLLFEMRTG